MMSITENFNVYSIPKKIANPWILKKHYANRLTPITYSFGLYKNKELVGVCTFGYSIARKLREKWPKKYEMQELNRLITEDGLPKNALSYFVSQCLKKLPSPMIVVSYADPNHGHHGYIYQATNWIYVGRNSKDGHPNIYIDDEQKHPRSLYDQHGTSSISKLKEIYGDRLKTKEKERKHRYYYFLGNKRQKRKMKKELRNKEKPYPKGDNEKYDTGGKLAKQTRLF